jgi:hypothetical protein
VRVAAGVLWAVAACVHVPLTAQPPAIAAIAPELADSGRADVPVDQGGSRRVFRDDVVSVTLRGNQRSHLWGLVKLGTPDDTQTMTLGELVAGCDATGRNRGCALAKVDTSIAVGTRERVDPARVGMFAFGALATTVGTLCLAICHERSGWEFVGVAIGATVMIVPLAGSF